MASDHIEQQQSVQAMPLWTPSLKASHGSRHPQNQQIEKGRLITHNLQPKCTIYTPSIPIPDSLQVTGSRQIQSCHPSHASSPVVNYNNVKLPWRNSNDDKYGLYHDCRCRSKCLLTTLNVDCSLLSSTGHSPFSSYSENSPSEQSISKGVPCTLKKMAHCQHITQQKLNNCDIEYMQNQQ